jgi:hypothetical protein
MQSQQRQCFMGDDSTSARVVLAVSNIRTCTSTLASTVSLTVFILVPKREFHCGIPAKSLRSTLINSLYHGVYSFQDSEKGLSTNRRLLFFFFFENRTNLLRKKYSCVSLEEISSVSSLHISDQRFSTQLYHRRIRGNDQIFGSGPLPNAPDPHTATPPPPPPPIVHPKHSKFTDPARRAYADPPTRRAVCDPLRTRTRARRGLA